MAEKLLTALVGGLLIALAVLLLAKKKPADGETTTLTPNMSIVATVAANALLFLAVLPLAKHADVSSLFFVSALAPLLVYVAYRPLLAVFINPLLFLATSTAMYLITDQEQLADNYYTQYEPLGLMLYIIFGSVCSFFFGFLGLIGANRNHTQQKDNS